MSGAVRLLLASALVLAGCSVSRSSDVDDASTDTTSFRVGEGVVLPSAPSTTAVTPGAAAPTTAAAPSGPAATAIRVRVLSPADRPLAGIPVRATGSARAEARSGPDGVAVLALPAGRYRIETVVGCHERRIVRDPATARVDLPADQVVEGTLRVQAQRRFAPGAPSTYRALGPEGDRGEDARWPVGAPYLVTAAVTDRCTGQRAPAAASLVETEWVPDGGVRLVGRPPQAAGADGRVTVTVSCATAGEILSLVSRDQADPRDAIELLDHEALERPAPTCVAD